MYGEYRRLKGAFENGVLTGKGFSYGGSLIRPEATGFGAVYYLENVLKHEGEDLKGKTIACAGFGNVTWGICKKATELGAKVVTLSGPDGYVYRSAHNKIERTLLCGKGGNSTMDIRKPFLKSFTVKELMQFIDYYIEHKEMLHVPGHPWEVCDLVARFLGLGYSRQWAEDETAVLVENYPPLGAEKTSELLLMRTAYDCKEKADRLGLYTNVKSDRKTAAPDGPSSN